jgi:hypothetical protein
MSTGFSEIDDVAKTVVLVGKTAADLRSDAFFKHGEEFKKLFLEYGVDYESFFLGDGEIFYRAGDFGVKIEYDCVNKEWFVVKVRGEKSVPEEKKVECSDFLKKLLLLEGTVHDEIRDGMKKSGFHYIDNPDLGLSKFTVSGEYRDEKTVVYVEIPLDAGAEITAIARLK